MSRLIEQPILAKRCFLFNFGTAALTPNGSGLTHFRRAFTFATGVRGLNCADPGTTSNCPRARARPG
eukprot:6452757-Alexandrium_andersonii.AAC.1